MPKDTDQVDHRAEALRLLEWVGDVCGPGDPRTDTVIAQAQVHASLAIAEGQERVVGALEGRVEGLYRQALEDIANLTLAEDRQDDNKVREEVWHRTQRALEESGV